MDTFDLVGWLSVEYGAKPKAHLIDFLIANWNREDVVAEFAEGRSPQRATWYAYAHSSQWPRIKMILQDYRRKHDDKILKLDEIDAEINHDFESLAKRHPRNDSRAEKPAKADRMAHANRFPSSNQDLPRTYLYGYCVSSDVFVDERKIQDQGAAVAEESPYVMGYFILHATGKDMRVERAEAFWQPKTGCAFDRLRGTWTSQLVGFGPESMLFTYRFRYVQNPFLQEYMGLVAAKISHEEAICGSGPAYEGGLYVLERYTYAAPVSTMKDGKIYISLYKSYDPDSFDSIAEIEKLKDDMAARHTKWHEHAYHIAI